MGRGGTKKKELKRVGHKENKKSNIYTNTERRESN
jgi:hypothetical protein